MPSTLLRRLTTTLVIVFAGAAGLAAAPAHAANTYSVNSTADTPDANVADARCETADHVCTLRAAIQQANATANDPDGPDQILLGESGRIMLDTELPKIVTDMDIHGPGVLWGNADAQQRVLSIGISANVRLSGLTIAHGWTAMGGGIYNLLGNLTLTDCVVDGNFATEGGGIWSAGGSLTIVRSIIGRNGAIAQDEWRNSAGGGLYLWDSPTTIADSTFYLNGAYYGGGLFNRDSELSISGTTFSRNNALTIGGAIDSSEDASTDLVNSTLIGNSARSEGGAIDNDGTLSVRNSTITGNSATSAGGISYGDGTDLRSTIVAGNTASSGPDLGGPSRRAVFSKGGNLIGNGAGVTLIHEDGPEDQVGTAAAPIDPKLAYDPNGPLEVPVSGGPTKTLALLPGSPAVDRGVDAPAPDTDQRGVPRRRGAHVDVGAYETPNRAPVHTVPEDIQYTGEDTPLVFSAATGNAIVVADPDSSALTTTVSVPAGSGTLDSVTFNGSAAEITEALDGLRFTPAPDANGPLQLTVKTTDHGDGTPDSTETDTDTVAINVRAANDPPVASDDTLAPNPQVIPFAELLANDAAGPANEAGQTLTVTAVKDGKGGTVKLSDTGVVFTPAPDYRGPAEFIYEVQDNGSTNDEDDPRTTIAHVRFDVGTSTAAIPSPAPVPVPPHTIAPTVKRVSSAAGKVVVTFSEAVDPRALTVRIKTRGGGTVKTTIRYDKVRHRIVSGRLPAGRYVVMIRGALTGKWNLTVRR